MRRYQFLLGTVLALGGAVGAWVHAQDVDDSVAATEATAPQAFEESGDAQPLAEFEEETDSSVTVDTQVQPSAATETPHVAARRSGGLAGRLQAIRRSEQSSGTSSSDEDTEPAAAPAAMPVVAKPAARPTTTVTAPAAEIDETNTATEIPSVLKRPTATAPVATSPATTTRSASDRPASSLPAASSVRPSQRNGGVVPRPAATTTPASTPAASEGGVKRVAQRAQTLATGANASLSVETNGPKAMMLGKPASYTVMVNNLGVSEAKEVYVAVTLPPHVELSDVRGTTGDARPSSEGKGQRLVWQIERIAGRGQEKLTLELIPLSGAPVDFEVEWTMAPPMISSQIEVQEPKLTMELKGPKEVQYGETAVYQIIVANPGTGEAEDVVVNLLSADATAGDAKKIGALAAGQQKIIEVSMTASMAGSMKMHFGAKSGTLTAEVEEDVIVRRANIEVEMHGPQLVFAGADATYQVQVTNSGDAPADNVQMGVILPEGAEYLGGITGAVAKAGQLVWSGGVIAPGKTVKFEFTCQMNTAGTSDVQFQAKSNELSADTVATTKVEAVADLKLIVADPLGPKPVGEEVTYQVTITNRGTKAARKVAVVVNFSEGVEPTAVEGAKAELGAGQALFQPIASIDAGGEVVLKIKAKASKAGSHIFRAEVRCTDPDTRLATEQTNRFFGSSVSVAGDEANASQPVIGAKPTKTKLR